MRSAKIGPACRLPDGVVEPLHEPRDENIIDPAGEGASAILRARVCSAWFGVICRTDSIKMNFLCCMVYAPWRDKTNI